MFNRPERCSGGVCDEDDVFGDPVPPQTSVLWASGLIAGLDGVGNFSARLRRGRPAGEVLFGSGLRRIRQAEIHIVIRTHGAPILGHVAANSTSARTCRPPSTLHHNPASVLFIYEDDCMFAELSPAAVKRYANCIAASKRVHWEIDRDVIRGRRFDFDQKFLPDGLSQVDRLAFLEAPDRRLLSQIQGRTYANMFALVERFISAKILEISRDHWLGDQTALEALVRFTDEELKHQALFRCIERLTAEGMPPGYRFLPQPNEVAALVLGKSTWAVLALTCHIELFTQAHYRESIEPDGELSALYRDVFLFHWKEESQHAILDELEWRRADNTLTPLQRDQAVTELIELIVAVDALLQGQAAADADYFLSTCRRDFSSAEAAEIHATVLSAYRWQYIVSGAQSPRFTALLGDLLNDTQRQRVATALAPIMQ